MTCSEI